MDIDAVWNRVLSPSAGSGWEERLLWGSLELEDDLGLLPQAQREQSEISGLLRGIRALEGAKPLNRPPRGPGADPARCYRNSLALTREFAARAAHPETGTLWQAAADRQRAQCIRIAQAMGRSGPRRGAPV